MKLLTLAAACAALVTLSAAPALAGGDPVTAKLQTPVAEKTKFIAGGAGGAGARSLAGSLGACAAEKARSKDIRDDKDVKDGDDLGLCLPLLSLQSLRSLPGFSAAQAPYLIHTVLMFTNSRIPTSDSSRP